MISRRFEYIAPERSQFPKSVLSDDPLRPVITARHSPENLVRQSQPLSLSLLAPPRKPYHLNCFHRAPNFAGHPRCDISQRRLVCLGAVHTGLAGRPNLCHAASGILHTTYRLGTQERPRHSERRCVYSLALSSPPPFAQSRRISL